MSWTNALCLPSMVAGQGQPCMTLGCFLESLIRCVLKKEYKGRPRGFLSQLLYCAYFLFWNQCLLTEASSGETLTSRCNSRRLCLILQKREPGSSWESSQGLPEEETLLLRLEGWVGVDKCLAVFLIISPKYPFLSLLVGLPV